MRESLWLFLHTNTKFVVRWKVSFDICTRAVRNNKSITTSSSASSPSASPPPPPSLPLKTLGPAAAAVIAPTVDLWARRIQNGDMLDCSDTRLCWCRAEVKSCNDANVLIHYIGWSDRWDEWIARHSSRLAPPYSHPATTMGPAAHIFQRPCFESKRLLSSS